MALIVALGVLLGGLTTKLQIMSRSRSGSERVALTIVGVIIGLAGVVLAFGLSGLLTPMEGRGLLAGLFMASGTVWIFNEASVKDPIPCHISSLAAFCS